MDYFERIPVEFRPAIEAARDCLPRRLRKTLAPRFLCGVSPIFAGLHTHERVFDGRSYHDTAHVVWGEHTGDEVARIVYPALDDPDWAVYTILHELGHVFDYQTHFELAVPKTTAYSDTNRRERVAEGFVLSLLPRENTYRWRCGQEGHLESEAFRPFRELVFN